MRDDVQVCILMRPDLRETLRIEAKKQRLSMSRLVEVALRKLLKLGRETR